MKNGKSFDFPFLFINQLYKARVAWKYWCINIKYFEIDNYPYMEFYVYTPILTGNERIFTPKELTNRNLVHDAHVTNEYCILDPVYMQLINHIKIFNTNKNEIQYYQPFNNKSKSKIVFAPKTIKWEYIK